MNLPRLYKSPDGDLFYNFQWLEWVDGNTIDTSAWTADSGLTAANGAIRQGTFSANGAALAGARSVAVDGLSISLGEKYQVQFAGHSRVYTLTDTIAAGGSTLRITPPLEHDVADDEVIRFAFTVVQLSGGVLGKEYEITNAVAASGVGSESYKAVVEITPNGLKTQ